MTAYCSHCEWSIPEGQDCGCAAAVEERRVEALEARVIALEERLREIAEIAHVRSTGPAVYDSYWEIRELAYEYL